MCKVRPRSLLLVGWIEFALTGDELRIVLQFFVRRWSTEGGDIHPFDARGGVLLSLFGELFGPVVGLLNDELIVHQAQGLSRHVRHRPAADRRERGRIVERLQHGRQEISPHVDVDTAPPIAIQGPAGRPAAAIHVGGQIGQHSRTELILRQAARNGQDLIANDFCFQP